MDGRHIFHKKSWPIYKNHLDWETRNFDADRNGLYDAYAAIWASDALQYSGGDVTHSSAYNYRAYKKAAQIAKLLGENPEPYEVQARKILKSLNDILWIPEKGIYAEYKDRLGNKLLHPSAALWTIYHSIDSDVPDKFQSYQLLRYVDNEIPHIPIKANGLQDDGYYTLSTSNWMPYTWSLNNVALAESMHTALANWQAGRTDEAFKLFKSEVLSSMYMGGSPGNFVQISHYDAIRGEAYRDFADPIGIFSRALVEGLFGIVPDALNKTIFIRPGLPSNWDRASFETPDIKFDFTRSGKIDQYQLRQSFSVKLNLNMQVIAQGQVEKILVNGKAISWKNIDDAVGKPVIDFKLPYATNYGIQIIWKDTKPLLPLDEQRVVNSEKLHLQFANAKVIGCFDPQKTLQKIKTENGLSAEVHATEGKHTLFVQLQQGVLKWWLPISLNVVATKVTNSLPIPSNQFIKQETVDLSTYYNDKLTQIFKNKYLSPRPQTTTLQLPWQGIGDWPHPLATADIDDSGLRKLAGQKNRIHLPQGIDFSTMGDNGQKILCSLLSGIIIQKKKQLRSQEKHLMLGS